MRLADSHPVSVSLGGTLLALQVHITLTVHEKQASEIPLKDGNNQSETLKSDGVHSNSSMRLSRLLAVQSCRWGKEKMTNTHWFVRHRWNWGIREVRGGKGSILTLMENYVCLPDIHEVYSYFSFVFLTIHPNDSRNRRSLQLPGIFPAVVNRIQNKSVGCSTLYLKYHHKSLLRQAQLSCSQVE